jgi:hypothetical protein
VRGNRYHGEPLGPGELLVFRDESGKRLGPEEIDELDSPCLALGDPPVAERAETRSVAVAPLRLVRWGP